MNDKMYWHALYTKPRWEKKVAALLDEQGVEYYCPLNKVTRQWSDRKKTVLEPLFKSYVFVKVSTRNKWQLLHITGVLNFVTWLGKPACISEAEIATIKKFLKEFDAVEVVEQLLEVNTTVKIRQGILMNYQGLLLRVSGNRASVKIDSMGVQLVTTIDKKNLERVLEKRVHHA